MIAIALLFVRLLCDCFKPRSRLEAEIVVLRHQLAELRRGAPRRLYLRWADRVLFVWLYRRLSFENPLWGAPRIHGELLKLGIEVAQSTVSKYMVPRQGRPLQTWKTFLRMVRTITESQAAVPAAE